MEVENDVARTAAHCKTRKAACIEWGEGGGGVGQYAADVRLEVGGGEGRVVGVQHILDAKSPLNRLPLDGVQAAVVVDGDRGHVSNCSADTAEQLLVLVPQMADGVIEDVHGVSRRLLDVGHGVGDDVGDRSNGHIVADRCTRHAGLDEGIELWRSARNSKVHHQLLDGGLHSRHVLPVSREVCYPLAEDALL